MNTFEYTVNDEPQTTTEHELTASAILTLAGFDPTTHYLILLKGHERDSFQGNPDAVIHMHEHMKFLAISTEPTPVSLGSSMTGIGFAAQLAELGYRVEDRGDGKVCFPYTIPVGKYAGKEVMLGFVVPLDFPLTPPGGPHFAPHLLPISQTSGVHPSAGIHPSPFGEGWQYWSRPLQHWNSTKKTVSVVMAHVLHLLETL